MSVERQELCGEHPARLPGVPVERAHPLAAVLWGILRDRSEADRRLVFEACSRRLAPGRTTDQQAIALHALERFRAQQGKVPSRRQYDAFRSSQPNPKAWPPSSLIRNAFGGWSRARVALGEPEPDVLARRLRGNG